MRETANSACKYQVCILQNKNLESTCFFHYGSQAKFVRHIAFAPSLIIIIFFLLCRHDFVVETYCYSSVSFFPLLVIFSLFPIDIVRPSSRRCLNRIYSYLVQSWNTNRRCANKIVFGQNGRHFQDGRQNAFKNQPKLGVILKTVGQNLMTLCINMTNSGGFGLIEELILKQL